MKYIKNFESSYFHSIDDIDKILDKISEFGYESLDDSDKAILLNYSKDDEDIHAILVKLNGLVNDYLRLSKKVSVLVGSDKKEIEKSQKEWNVINTKMNAYENMLRYLYKIDNPKDIFDYSKKQGLMSNNENL